MRGSILLVALVTPALFSQVRAGDTRVINDFRLSNGVEIPSVPVYRFTRQAFNPQTGIGKP